MLQGILRNPHDEDRPMVTTLKVKMKRAIKPSILTTEPKVAPVSNQTNAVKTAFRQKTSSCATLEVPGDKRARRLSDSLDIEKQKHPPRMRRRSVSFDPFTVFKTAILDNDVETTKNVLVSGKVDANTAVDGILPIVLASKDGCAECLQLLIEHGAEIDVHDRHGMSPLELAVREGHFDCAQILISSGANANSIRDGYFDDTIEKANHSAGRSRSRTF